ncbi:MAG: alkylhydroperoxidase-related (seleno)protein [Pseudomonadales bacterium]|nr:alkylhydroperoxidase-related (seleno)protein [Pseudomonadales bacterium]
MSNLNQALSERPDIQIALSNYFLFLAEPGYWWHGAQKVAIAAAARAASSCSLCAEKKAALSRNQIKALHAENDQLSPLTVDMIHQIITDQGRITESQVQALEQSGVSRLAYAELVGIVVCLFSIDEFCRALSQPLLELPQPQPGLASQRTPDNLETNTGFVPMIAREGLTEAVQDLWPEGFGANVIRALSAAPDLVRQWKQLAAVFYLPLEEMRNLTQSASRRLNRMQMELIAGRVSAINRCFY